MQKINKLLNKTAQDMLQWQVICLNVNDHSGSIKK